MSPRLGVRCVWSSCRALSRRRIATTTQTCVRAASTSKKTCLARAVPRRTYATGPEHGGGPGAGPPGGRGQGAAATGPEDNGRDEALEDADEFTINDDLLDQLYGNSPAAVEAGGAEIEHAGKPRKEWFVEEENDAGADAAYGESRQAAEDALLELEFPDETTEDAAADLPGALSPEQQETLYQEGHIPPRMTGDPVEDALAAAANGDRPPIGTAAASVTTQRPNAGPRWPLPDLPLPPGSHLKHRYHPVLHQFTNLVMRDGKLSVAQGHVAHMLNFLRTSPPPMLSPKYPLLPNAPPASHLPLNPILYLTLAVDSVAPLLKIQRLKGLAGSGAALEVPTPIPVRTRRRTAFGWILDAVARRRSTGSGRKQLGSRLADEIVAVVEGRSGVWEKREAVHRAAVSARANTNTPAYALGRRKKK